MSEELSLHEEIFRDRVPAGERNAVQMTRLTLVPSPTLQSAHANAGCDVLLLLDSSGSMDEPFRAGSTETKRDGVVAAGRRMVRSLRAEDRVTVVFFDNRAHIVLEGVRGDQAAEIVAAIERIREFSGMTNFQRAMEFAREWTQRTQRASRRVVFLTDGIATSGSATEVARLAAELAAAGVTTDCLGVGTDFAFDAMQELSRPSNGETHQVMNAAEAGDRFTASLRNGQQALIQRVMLRLVVPAGHRDVELYQASPEIRVIENATVERSGRVTFGLNVGALEREHTFVLRSRMDVPSRPGPAQVCECFVDYEVPVLASGRRSARLPVWMDVVAGRDQEVVDSAVEAVYLDVSLTRLELEFRRKQGDWREAAKVLAEMEAQAERGGPALAPKRRLYGDMRRKLIADHRLSQHDLNTVFATNSKPTAPTSRRSSAPAGPNPFASASWGQA